MDTHLKIIQEISRKNDRKILLVVIDGVGGLDHPEHGNLTELQAANAPNLDALVQNRKTETGMIYPVDRGYTPGSSTGHFGLFGYDPLHEGYKVGRGAMEAADLEGPFGPFDVIARFNFCTMENGVLTDRRAGRTPRGKELVEKLNGAVRIPGARFEAVATREHRGILILRDESGEYSEELRDTDPGMEGVPPRPPEPLDPDDARGKRTADLIRQYVEAASSALADAHPANQIVLRGFSRMPKLPQYGDVFKLDAAAVATYPLYRGVARLVGMQILERATDFEGQLDVIDAAYDDHEFFFLHYKKTDSCGEDGDFSGKVEAIEEFDRRLPRLIHDKSGRIRFDAVAITGDHSTPAVARGHSHHSVPIAIYSPTMRCFDESRSFNEKECLHGSLGTLRGKELMRILLAATGKLGKFGG